MYIYMSVCAYTRHAEGISDHQHDHQETIQGIFGILYSMSFTVQKYKLSQATSSLPKFNITHSYSFSV